MPEVGTIGLFLHYDNAGAYTVLQGVTRDFTADKPIQVLSHTSYSPDLSSCDYFVFPKVRDLLRGIVFGSPEAAVNAYKDHL